MKWVKQSSISLDTIIEKRQRCLCVCGPTSRVAASFLASTDNRNQASYTEKRRIKRYRIKFSEEIKISYWRTCRKFSKHLKKEKWNHGSNESINKFSLILLHSYHSCLKDLTCSSCSCSALRCCASSKEHWRPWTSDSRLWTQVTRILFSFSTKSKAARDPGERESERERGWEIKSEIN